MKHMIVAVLAAALALAAATPASAHGGGCRKASPEGQCCHLETRTGVVHCHTRGTAGDCRHYSGPDLTLDGACRTAAPQASPRLR